LRRVARGLPRRACAAVKESAMSVTPARLALALTVVLLAACRKEVPPPVPPAEPAPKVSAGVENPSASDRSNAPPAIGALTAGQDKGGQSGRPIQPSGGDGTPAASAASAPASRASPP
jgi:hypothetical protein